MLDLPSEAGMPWRCPNHPWHGELVITNIPKRPKCAKKWRGCSWVIRTIDDVLAVSISRYQRTYHSCLRITVYNNVAGIIPPHTATMGIKHWSPSSVAFMQCVVTGIRACWQTWLILCAQTIFYWTVWATQTSNEAYNYKKLDETGDGGHTTPVLAAEPLICTGNIKNNGDNNNEDHVHRRSDSFRNGQNYQHAKTQVNARRIILV